MTTTQLARRGERQRGILMHKKVLTVAAVAATLVSCKAGDLAVPNPNVASATGAAADPTALQLLFTGLFSDIRGQRSNMILQSAVFGREGYTLSPQDGRFATVPLIGVVVGGVTKIDPAVGFTNNAWSGEYGVLRDLYNFKKAINANATLSAAQKAGALGI